MTEDELLVGVAILAQVSLQGQEENCKYWTSWMMWRTPRHLLIVSVEQATVGCRSHDGQSEEGRQAFVDDK